MVGRVEVRGRELGATTGGDAERFQRWEAAEHETRRQVDLGFAGVRAVLVIIGVVDFELGPELAVKVILEGVVPGVGASILASFPVGREAPKVPCRSKWPKPLP